MPPRRISGQVPPPSPGPGGARISGQVPPPAQAPQTSPYQPSAQIAQQNRVRLRLSTAAPTSPQTAQAQGTLVRIGNMIPAQQQRPVPGWMPEWLGNQRVVVYAWIIAMAAITFDEWHNNHILPRPSRLWYATLTYGILAVTGMVGFLTPITNMLAIGYSIMLIWQYFNKQGQFA